MTEIAKEARAIMRCFGYPRRVAVGLAIDRYSFRHRL